MKYIIASGWWSCDSEEDTREKLFGDDEIRDVEFHRLWRECIDSFTSAQEIVVVDSASPKKPENTRDEKWLNMSKNFGHSTNHHGQFSGATRSFFLSMMYAYVNDYDYWVYVEQDALIYGEGIIERVIEESKKGVAFGPGNGTPQEIQQSLMIVKREKILSFIYNYVAIRESDQVISPEWKFLFAQNSLARRLPTSFLRWLSEPSIYTRTRPLKRGFLNLLRKFDQFDTLSFGSGRARPINFSANHFYFQHGNRDEIATFKRKMKNLKGINLSLVHF